ncbi:TRPM8 channel-associated factor homolog [Megalops cyprinoides]|uniref:TRPM8 channel-associated factor homolog n=1 Tax=Megalops cyprinoides TaxID=118141 RepID=UPI001864D9A5|nr:TRPM8 channel-associated factor homolog [Megalops cyprinoides]
MAYKDAYSALMKGVEELDCQGPAVPGDLVLIGDHAFPLAMNPRGKVLMAASRYGQGRIVVLGHEAFLTTFPAVVENALTWLKPSTDAQVGIHSAYSAVAHNLFYTSIQAEVGGFHSGLGVYVTDAYSVGPTAKELVAFLKEGGGLLVAGQAWSWAMDHPKENILLGFPGNKVCSVAGIYFSEHPGQLGVFPVPRQIPSSWLAVSKDEDFKDDLEFLLEGVSAFDIQGDALPSEVLVHGPLAFPIATTNDGRAFIAGSYYGQGRVIVTTHESYLGHQALAPFLINAVRWLDEGRNGTVGILPELSGAHALLSQSGLTCEKTRFKQGLSVYVCTSYSDAHAADIQEFVAEGGGLLIGGHAWYWAQTHSGHNAVTEYPGNHILNKMGFSILEATLNAGLYEALQSCSEAYHFRRMLQNFMAHVTCGQTLTEHEQACLKRLGTDCVTYLHMRAHDCPSYNSILNMLTNMVKKAGVPQVCASCPVENSKDHLLLHVGTEVYKASPNPDDLLPYIIKDRPYLPTVPDARVWISGNTEGSEEWKSTGLYLSPGMKTHMAIPSQIVGKGWEVQIGCQTDYVGNADELIRAPVVHERFPIESDTVQVSNLWGGLIYLVAPSNCHEGELEITVEEAIRAPYYKSGETSVAAWVGGIRDAPAPWAEMEFENIIMTVPSEVVRHIDQPDEVAEVWDTIMRSIAELAAIPAKFPRKERFVADVQISHGFMHAGYPVMMHSSSAPDLMIPKLVAGNGGNIWGAIHELGHNQQQSAWEFPPHTTECTCNLWSVYVHETVLDVERADAHGDLKPSKRQKRIMQFLQSGRELDNWKVWTALETYMQLQEEFGWEAFKKVFAAYHQMQNVPSDNEGKMNLYAETFSRSVNRNLVPFFKSWGWPIEPELEWKLEDLPEWSDHPIAKYKDL